ncbi:DUF3530 family protein [Amphritea sp. 1_MG-2023]|uniref:DUF3530 family protein n=1 Tax=Amphritea sp. 1_MG-2023 TaxID=3062670 RepID=UPI0026E3820F|nr:DUF3530 family protein [Amphritea sp. 1_MG-2023]MDO6563967.1 DUF3530 family protein [Amphritea sp. 1_MG-2023]
MKLKPLFLTLFLSWPMLLTAAENDNITDTSATPSDAADATDSVNRALPDPARQRQIDLAKAQPADTEVIWLELNQTKQLALLQRATTSSPTGSILIFTPPASSADWPDLIHPLRTQLTEYGWNTLSLSLPTPPEIAIPQRTLPSLQNRQQLQSATSGAETAVDVSTNTATTLNPEASKNSPNNSATSSAAQTNTAYQNNIIALADLAAARLAATEGEIKIMLGIGEGAVWAMHYFAQNETQEHRYLVLLDPVQAEGIETPDLLAMISQSQAPILDLWFNRSRYQQQQATLRKHTAQRSGNSGYRQIRLNQRRNAVKKQPLWLTRQLRGILKTHLNSITTSTLPQRESIGEPTVELTPGS